MGSEDDWIEVPADRFFDKALPIEGEMVKMNRHVQPVVILEDTEARGKPGSGPRVKAGLQEGGGVVEASAASSNIHLGRIATGIVPNGIPQITERTESETGNSITRKRQPRIVAESLTCDGAGAVAATAVVPAVAGFFAVIDSVRVIADQTDAGYTLTFASTSGMNGHVVHALTSTANVVDASLVGVLMNATADNEDITAAIVGHQAGAVVTLIIEFHYET